MTKAAFLMTSVMLLSVSCLAEAQSAGALRRIAFLASDEPCSANIGFQAFVEGLRSLGYREGASLVIECRSAEGQYERLDVLAAELSRQKPAVLVAAAAPASLAAKRATTSIPVVSVHTADPVGLGLVASLARPESNVTGISALASDYAAKSLQLLREVAPRTTRVGVFGNASIPTYAVYRRELESAARIMGLAIDFASASAPDQIDTSLTALRDRGVDAFLVMHQPFTFTHRERIVSSVARLRLPAMYGSREAVESGGLMSFAASIADSFRRASYFVDRVFRGAKPRDLPFEQPTKFELVMNARAARTLGLTVPRALLLRADQVLE